MHSKESFAIHVSLANPDGVDASGWLPEHDESVAAVTRALADTGVLLEGAVYSAQGYGYGADGVAAGIVLAGLSTVFLAGKKLEENIDAWIRLGRRLRQTIHRLTERGISASFSEPAIVALVLELLARDGQAEALSVLSVTTVPVHNSSLTPQAHSTFLAHPDRYVVVVVRSAKERVYVVTMSATGRLCSHAVIPLNKWAYEYAGR